MRYAEIADLTAMGKNLTAAETSAAEIMLDAASAKLRLTAKRYGKSLEKLFEDEEFGEDYRTAVKSIIVQAVLRGLKTMSDNSSAISQGSQSALGYSATVTYFNPGQSVYFLKNELKEIGLLRQRYGALEVYGNGPDTRNND